MKSECSDMVTLNQGLGRFRKVVLVLWPDLTMIGFSMGLIDGLDRHRCNPLVGIIGNSCIRYESKYDRLIYTYTYLIGFE